MRAPTKAEWAAGARWARDEAAEFIVGSWALILGWLIVGVIFLSFLQMDGYFSRGLGEGSGVDPDLFMHIGWMFRLFAALFLVFTVKLKSLGMVSESRWIRVIGVIVTILVVAHALGFGLKALEGKRSNAVAVTEVASTVTESNDTIIATLNAQKEAIRADLEKQTQPLKDEIKQYITDGKSNDDLAQSTRDRRKELEDKAQAKIDAIDDEIVAITTKTGEHKATSTKEIATTEKWAPLFVGLAQLFTWNPNPDDWWVYVAGVLFLGFWILVGDAICIFMPHALYKMHLADAKRRKFAAMGQKGGTTTARRNRVRGKLKAIEDLRNEKAQTQADLTEDAPEEPAADDFDADDDDLTEEDQNDDDADSGMGGRPAQAAE